MKVIQKRPGDVPCVALENGKMYLGRYKWFALGGVAFYSTKDFGEIQHGLAHDDATWAAKIMIDFS